MKIFLWQVYPSSDNLKQPGIIRVQQNTQFFPTETEIFLSNESERKTTMKKLSLILVFLLPLFPVMVLSAESICLEGNCVSGNGVMLYGDGEKYAGDFKEGKRQGYGILTAKNGKRYEGDWANDLQNGQGTMISTNGEKYIGAFKDGVKQGEGQLAFPNGEVYTGVFDRGEPSGRGCLCISNR